MSGKKFMILKRMHIKHDITQFWRWASFYFVLSFFPDDGGLTDILKTPIDTPDILNLNGINKATHTHFDTATLTIILNIRNALNNKNKSK